MSTGIITTAIVLLIGYIIVSRIVGMAFRLAVPLVLLVLLGGAGIFSSWGPERSPADLYAPYEQAQDRSGAGIGDLRLRDIADIAVDAFRSLLEGSLALLNGITEPEPRREPRWPDEPRQTLPGEPYGTPPASPYDPRRREMRDGW